MRRRILAMMMAVLMFLSNDGILALAANTDSYTFTSGESSTQIQEISLEETKQDEEPSVEESEQTEKGESETESNLTEEGEAGTESEKKKEGEAGTESEKTEEGEVGTESEKKEEGEAGSESEKTEEGETGTESEKTEEGEVGSESEKTEEGEMGTESEKTEEGEAGTESEKTEEGETGSESEKTEESEAGTESEKTEEGEIKEELATDKNETVTNGAMEEENADQITNDTANVSSEGFSYELSNGGAVITGYSGSETELIIPERVDQILVQKIKKDAFKDKTITAVTIPDSVESIGNNAFKNCTNLKEVNLGSGLTTIGSSAFYDAPIERLEIPKGVTSIGSNAFNKVREIVFEDGMEKILDYACSGATELVKVTIPASVKEIGDSAFYNCQTLVNVIIPNSVINIGNSAFESCVALSNVSLGSGLETIESYAFENCTNLTEMELGNAVTAIGYRAFYNVPIECWTIPNKVTSIGSEAFNKVKEVIFEGGMTEIPNNACNGSSELERVTIPDSVTNIGSSAFYNCVLLESISLGSNLEYIESNAFYGCKALASVKIPDNVKDIGSYAFYNCTNLTEVKLGSALTSIGYDVFYNVPMESVVIPKGVTSIGSNAFNNAKEIIFEEGMTKIPNSACYGATELVKVTIPGSVTEIGNSAFYNCALLSNVSLGSGLETIGDYAFKNCKSLVNIVIPDSVISLGESAFYDCVVLSNVSLGNGLQTIGSSAFYNVPIESWVIPKGVTSIGSGAFNKAKEIVFEEGITKIPDYACSGAYELVKVTIPDSATEIGGSAFYNCTNLKEVNLGSAVATIGASAFYNCKALEKIEIGNDVTVQYSAFRYCSAVTELIIGDNCIIENYAFANCSNLKTISIGENVTFGNYVFEGVVLGGTCTETVSWKIDVSNKTLIISGSGDMADYTSKKDVPWIALNSMWDFVSIENGIISVGDYSFEGCDNITNIMLPESIQKIGAHAFYDCNNLSYIEFTKSVSEIGSYAFAECDSLKEIVFCGNAPVFEEEALLNKKGVTAYYPETGSGWIRRIFDKFANITWKEWDNTIPSNDIVLVLDRSGSMSGRMEKLKEASSRFLQGIGGRLSNTRVAIVEYDDVATVLSEFSTDKMDQINKIQTLTARGGTEYQKALRRADELLQKSNADFRSIVMFSDGEPNDSESAISTLAESLRENYNIYTVGLISSQSQREVLIDVAGFESHYFEVDDINGLLQAFLKLLKDFGKTEYTTVELKRNDNRYDLLKEEHAFCVDSPEQISIYITPGTKYEGVVKIALEQNGKQILTSATGNFENIIPGSLFTDKGDVYVVLYDSKNNKIESLPLMVMMKREFLIIYNMNDGQDTVYLTDTIVNGVEVIEPEEPEREGYDFKGWYSSKECTGYTFFSSLNYFNRIKIENDITLYAKWKPSDKNFNILDDAWSFVNSTNPFYSTTKEISVGDYQALIQNLDNATKEAVEDYKNKLWNGSCFGMSSSAVLMNANVIRLVDFDANFTMPGQVTTLYHNQNGDADVGNIESMINYYHLRQLVGSVNSIRSNYSRTSESTNIKKIIEKLENSKHPVVLTLFVDTGTISGGHAVVAYDLKYDQTQSTYTFSVYDCSFGNTYNGQGQEYTVTVTKSILGYKKSCPEWEARWGSIFLYTALTSDELQQEDILKAPSVISMRASDGQQADYYILNTGYSNFIISDGDKNAVIKDGDKVSGDLNIECLGMDSEVGEKPNYKFHLPVLSADMKYTISSQENGEFVTSILYSHDENGFFSSIESALAGTVMIASDGSIDTKYQAATKQTIKLTKNKKSTPWYNVTIEGEDNGFKVESDEEKMYVSSVNQTQISLLIQNDFNNLEFKDIEVSANGIIVENENGSCVIKNAGNTVEAKDFGYSVVFNSQCGTSVDTLVNVASGALITEPKDITREGYIFEGWFKEKECITLWDFSTDKVTEDTVLYAGWSVDENYFVSVTFKVAGHDSQIIYLPQNSMLEKEKCPINQANVDGIWYTEDTFENEWDYTNGVVTKNIILYGKGKDCKVSFETGCDTKIEPIVTYAGKFLEEPNVELVKEGYTLCGWTSDSNGRTDWKFNRDKVMDDMVLYARWVANERDTKGTDTKICIDILDQHNQTYTGKPVLPQIVVRDGNVILEEGKDYKVSYKNNTNVCNAEDPEIKDNKKPQIIVQGINGYKAQKKFVKYFSITQANMEDLEVTVPSYVAVKTNDKLQKIKAVVKTSKITVPASNYLVRYYTDEKLENEVNGITAEGTYYVVVEAKQDATGKYVGNYFGKSSAKEVVVLAKNLILSSAKIDAAKKITCLNDSLESEDAIRKIIRKVTLASDVYLTEGSEIETFKQYFEVEAVDANGKKISQKNLSVILETAGKKVVILRAKKSNEKGYVGEVKLNITVEGTKIKKEQFSLTYEPAKEKAVTSADYTGQVLEPIISSQLELDRDYQITYKYNKKVIGKDDIINAGNYSAVITGINKYSGNIELKFKINKINITNAYTKGQITISKKSTAAEYNPNGATMGYSLSYSNGGTDSFNSVFAQLEEGKDYSVSYKNNKKPTTNYLKPAYAVIQGKGNYTGSLKGDGKTTGKAKKGIARELNFTINKKYLNSKDITVVVKELTYNNQNVPNVKLALYDNGKLIPTKEYTYNAYTSGDQIGVSISYNSKNKKGNYTSSRYIYISGNLIKTTDANEVLISLKDQDMDDLKYYYSGEQFKPEVVIQNKYGEDIASNFTIEYGENTKVGKGTITIIGKPENGYCESKTINFVILPKWAKWLF